MKQSSGRSVRSWDVCCSAADKPSSRPRSLAVTAVTRLLVLVVAIGGLQQASSTVLIPRVTLLDRPKHRFLELPEGDIERLSEEVAPLVWTISGRS